VAEVAPPAAPPVPSPPPRARQHGLPRRAATPPVPPPRSGAGPYPFSAQSTTNGPQPRAPTHERAIQAMKGVPGVMRGRLRSWRRPWRRDEGWREEGARTAHARSPRRSPSSRPYADRTAASRSPWHVGPRLDLLPRPSPEVGGTSFAAVLPRRLLRARRRRVQVIARSGMPMVGGPTQGEQQHVGGLVDLL